MKHLLVSRHFHKDLKKLSHQDQAAVAEALKSFLRGLPSGVMPKGLGFKKIGTDHYEIRAGLRVRIAMKAEGDSLVCHVVGNHESIKRFLRNY